MQAAGAYVAALAGMLMLATGHAETHWQVQAVDETGRATYFKIGAIPDPANRIVLEGVLLNNPHDMLNPAYNAPGFMGGQWQVFVQGEGDDHAGTAVWMGQKYGMRGDVDYEPWEWAEELARVGCPAGRPIRAGDRVRVQGYALFFGGKANINERHNTSALLDFTVEYLGTSPGLPSPEALRLEDLRTAGNVDIFDPTRRTGGEYYQGRLVRIHRVHLVSGTWGPNNMLIIGDATGRTFPMHLGIHPVFHEPPNLGNTFDVVGILNQENALTSGYEIWVMGYNGGRTVLGALPVHAPGDINADGTVNVSDVLALADSWAMATGTPGFDPTCDLTGDGLVDAADLAQLAADWPAQ